MTAQGLTRGVHSQFLHPLELLSIDLIDVHKNPTQIFDGVFLIDCFDLVEKRIDGIVQFRVNVQRQTGRSDAHGHAPPLRELIGRGIRCHREHGIVQRTVNAFTEEDVIDVVVALKQLHLWRFAGATCQPDRECRLRRRQCRMREH